MKFPELCGADKYKTMEKEIINCRVFVTARFYDSRTEKVFTYFGPQSDQNEAIFDAEKSVLKLRSRRV